MVGKSEGRRFCESGSSLPDFVCPVPAVERLQEIGSVRRNFGGQESCNEEGCTQEGCGKESNEEGSRQEEGRRQEVVCPPASSHIFRYSKHEAVEAIRPLRLFMRSAKRARLLAPIPFMVEPLSGSGDSTVELHPMYYAATLHAATLPNSEHEPVQPGSAV
jgi:hypothetical protein